MKKTLFVVITTMYQHTWNWHGHFTSTKFSYSTVLILAFSHSWTSVILQHIFWLSNQILILELQVKSFLKAFSCISCLIKMLLNHKFFASEILGLAKKEWSEQLIFCHKHNWCDRIMFDVSQKFVNISTRNCLL